MAKDLFDHFYTRDWPDQYKFPLNEETTGFKVKEPLMKDINSSEKYLIITGFTSLSNLIEIFGTTDYEKLTEVRIVIGFEPEGRVSKKLPHYSLTTAIKNYWLKQNVSIKLCGPILNMIEKINREEIKFKVIDKLHAKIYVGDTAAILGSSNFSKNGISFQREANIRVCNDVDEKEKEQYNSIKLIAENYFELADDYTKDILDLLHKLLRDADWEEALARALAEVLESKWMLDYPVLYQAIVNNELWPTQKIGIAKAMKIIQDQGNLLIADPTGSGKTKFATVLAYTIFHWLAENGLKERSNALIISPKQVMENWQSEQSKFNLLFNKIESMGILSNSRGKNVDQLQKEIEKTSILLIDEAHNYLNWKSKRSLRIRPKKSSHVILATATPINKKADDLLRLIELLDIDNLSDDDLTEYIELRKRRNKHIDQEHLKKLKSYINLFIVRRTKRELNRMIEREPEAYRNSNGHLCKYPKTIPDIYSTGETDADRKIVREINALLTKIKGINYLQKLLFPPFLDSENDKKQYLSNRFKSAPALATFEVKSSLRSSHCALYEYLYGTEAANSKYGLSSLKQASGNIISKLKTHQKKLPARKFPDEWLAVEHKWIISEADYKKACEEEISIYEQIGQLVSKLSGKRELTKAKELIDKVNKFGKILAFDSTVLTLDYFEKILIEEKVDARVIVATGLSDKNKKIVRELFNNSNLGDTSKCIALCSDAMSESINLPGAKALVLLDMPSVLRIIEQRIGRLERMDSEHKEIHVYWPDDSEEYSLKGDERVIGILATTETLIGNNVEVPQKGVYEKYLKGGLDTKNIIKAFSNFSENDGEWEGVKDSTEQLYGLIGKGGLISDKIYKEYKDVDSTVKTAVSFIESNISWSFFAFRGDAKRSPKWLLIDHTGKAITDFHQIAEKLREYLTGKDIVQKRWKDVNTQEEIRKILNKLRQQERILLPWKKRRALDTGKKILSQLFANTNDDNRRNKIDRLLKLLDTTYESENIIDYDHFAELLLFMFLPAIDEKRNKQKRKRKVLTLRDLTHKDIVITNKDLDHLYENCQFADSLDELIASCIIAVHNGKGT